MLGLGHYTIDLWAFHVWGTGLVGLGFQVQKCQMRYNVDKVATALQGAEDTSSDSVIAIDCYQVELAITQVQGKGQAKQVHVCCVVVLFGY